MGSRIGFVVDDWGLNTGNQATTSVALWVVTRAANSAMQEMFRARSWTKQQAAAQSGVEGKHRESFLFHGDVC